MIPLLASLALAGAPTGSLGADWGALWPAIAQGATAPIALSEAELAKLAKGELLKRRERAEGGDRAVGALWTDAPREALWVAILDDQHDMLVSGLTERQLPGTNLSRKLLYQHLDMPWPVTDRQWVIDIQNNQELWQATGGAVWERSWTPADPALMPEPDPDAVWTPSNDGGWLLVTAGGGTLMIYHARSEIGGNIPDDLVTRYSVSALDELLRHVVKRACGLGDHYGPDHEPLGLPDGSALPAFTPRCL